MLLRFLISGLLLAGAFSALGDELDHIIAIVDDDVVMQSELAQQLSRVRAELRQQGSELPPTSVLEHQVMDRLVLEKIQLQLAEQTGVQVTEDNLDRAVEDIAKKNKISMDQFKEILRTENYDFDRFRQDIKHEIILAKLRREEVDKRIQASDREIDNELRKDAAGAGNNSEEYRVSHILVSIPSNATDSERSAANAKADSVLAKLNEGTEFGDLAVAMSDGPDALDKGDLGWRKIEEIPSLFADTLQSLEVNGHSQILKSSTGLHIIKLTGKRNGKKVMVDQTRVRHILITPNQIISEQDAIKRLRQLRLRLENGDDFAAMARTHSDDRGSALQGGDLGWVSKGQMVPEFEEVMNETEPGQLSQPFRSEFGWHILQVQERRAYDGTDEIRRAKARDAILARKREEAYQEWQRRLRDEAYVELRAKD